MIKCALVRLEGTTRQYCFWTIVEDIKAGQYVLVDTQNGLVMGKFIKYTTQTIKANRWLYKALSHIQLRSYLQAELEECGIDYNKPVKLYDVDKKRC